MKFLPAVLVIVVLAPASARAQHVHGVIELGVVVEGDKIAVSLDAPMSDVVGFEHAPESDAQASSIEQAAAMLADADAMFGLADSADCKASSAAVNGPAFLLRHIEAADADSDHHDEDHDDAHESHGDEHHHDEHDSSDGHGDHDEEEHSEVVANYEWACGDVSKLESLALLFTDNFASVETIEIQVLTAAGVQVLTTTGRAASVSLSPP